MNRIKIINILALLVLLINLTGVDVSAAGTNDILIMGSGQSEYNVSNGDAFDFEVKYKNLSESPLLKMYVSVDKSSSFYIDQGYSQANKEGDLGVDGEDDTSFRLVYKGTGNELNLVFDYEKDGKSEQFSQTLYLSVKKEKEQSSGNSQTSTSEYKPSFRIVGKVTSKQEEKNVSVEVPIKNISNFSAKDMQITMAADSADSPFTAEAGHLSIPIDEIKPDAEKKVTLDLIVKPTAKSGTYPVTLELRYGNLYGDVFSSTEVIYVDVENNDKSPSLILKGVEMLPKKPTPGEKFSASIGLENLGTLNAKDVKVTLKGFSNDGIIPEFAGVNYIKTIQGGKTGKLDFSLIVSDKIGVRSFPIEIAVDYKDELGNSYTEGFTYYVPIEGKDEGEVLLKIDNISVPSGVVVPDKDFKIGFDVVNSGTKELSNAKVWVSNEAGLICKSQSTTMIDSLQAGDKRSFEFVFTALTDAVTKNYPISINIEYDDEGALGETKGRQTVAQYVGVYVENTKAEETASTPRIIIDRYSISTGEAIAGKSFEIEFGILNTHKNIDVGNIGVSFLADEGAFLPAAESVSTIFIDEIKAGARVVKKMSFVTKYDVAPKNYLLNITFEYEDDKQKAYTLKETISIPVTQEQRLEISEIQVAMDAFIGQPIPVTLNFYNMGKSTLSNMMVKCKGDFDLQPGSDYFVGNFEPGRSDYYEAYVIPNKEGQIKGSVVFSFEDNTGKVNEIEKEFEVFVQGQMGMMDEDPMVMNPDMEGKPMVDGQMGQRGFPIRLLFIVAIPLVVIAGTIVLIVVLRKRKKARADLYENF